MFSASLSISLLILKFVFSSISDTSRCVIWACTWLFWWMEYESTNGRKTLYLINHTL